MKHAWFIQSAAANRCYASYAFAQKLRRDKPLGAEWQFGRALHAQRCSPAAVAEFGRSWK